MINIKKYWFLIILIPFLGVGQNNQLQGFDNLVNKTWVAEGEWRNGSKFKQEVSYIFDLNNSIVVTNSKGFTNQEQTEYGNRNHGIRQYNAEKDKIEFWEFDVFGGVTKGTVQIEDKNIWYHYQYGDATISDCWEYLDDTTYKFTVGIFKDDKWEAVYLRTVFKLKKD